MFSFFTIFLLICLWSKISALNSFPGGSVVKNPPASAGDMGSLPGSGRSPGEGNGTHSSILAWEILWTEELGGLQAMWVTQKSDMTCQLKNNDP